MYSGAHNKPEQKAQNLRYSLQNILTYQCPIIWSLSIGANLVELWFLITFFSFPIFYYFLKYNQPIFSSFPAISNNFDFIIFTNFFFINHFSVGRGAGWGSTNSKTFVDPIFSPLPLQAIWNNFDFYKFLTNMLGVCVHQQISDPYTHAVLES